MKTIGFLMMVPLLVVLVVFIVLSYKISINCTDYLKRAADANTVILAKQELKKAIDYLEKEKITSGYTSVFFNTPDEDIGFWYKNLKASFDELDKLGDNSSTLEKSNTLLKLRETIMDGRFVNYPDGISRYPYNALIFCLFLFSLVFFVSGVVFIVGGSKEIRSFLSP